MAPMPRQWASPADERDAHARARAIIDELSGPDARLLLGHVADENLAAFWSAYDARGLTVKGHDTS